MAPRRFAAQIAGSLGQESALVTEVVLLHLEALEAALALGVPDILRDQARWQRARLRAAGLPLRPEEIDRAVRDALRPLLDEGRRAEIDELQTGVGDDSEVTAARSVELPEGPARDYLFSALSGNRDAAIKVVREATFAGTEVSAIMMDILQPAQLELGRLWEEGRITIAHEHLTTAITQVALSLLYQRLQFGRTWSGFSLVATSVGSEAHDVGIRMVSDLLEQAGWRAAYLGADTPDRDLVEQLARDHADVLAVSVTMAGHLLGVRRLVATVRKDPRTAHVHILVGGRPFTNNPDLVQVVGADGWAPDAPSALALCQKWAVTHARVG